MHKNTGNVEIILKFEEGRRISSFEVSWRKKGLNIAKKRILQDRGALLEREGDLKRECKAMPEENFLRSWDNTEDQRRRVQTWEEVV